MTLKGKYSPMELTIFKALLSNRARATSDFLKRKVYPNKRDEPFNALIVVNRATATLAQKLDRNNEGCEIVRRKLPGKRQIETRLIRYEYDPLEHADPKTVTDYFRAVKEWNRI